MPDSEHQEWIALAADIRAIDGNHSLGAGAIADALVHRGWTRDKGLRTLLVSEHRKVVGEFSGNFGGHVAVRDGWVEYDDETPIEDCDVCAALGEEPH